MYPPELLWELSNPWVQKRNKEYNFGHHLGYVLGMNKFRLHWHLWKKLEIWDDVDRLKNPRILLMQIILKNTQRSTNINYQEKQTNPKKKKKKHAKWWLETQSINCIWLSLPICKGGLDQTLVLKYVHDECLFFVVCCCLFVCLLVFTFFSHMLSFFWYIFRWKIHSEWVY